MQRRGTGQSKLSSDPACPKSFPLCEMPDPNPGRLPQQTEPPTLQMSDHSFIRDCLRNDQFEIDKGFTWYFYCHILNFKHLSFNFGSVSLIHSLIPRFHICILYIYNYVSSNISKSEFDSQCRHLVCPQRLVSQALFIAASGTGLPTYIHGM